MILTYHPDFNTFYKKNQKEVEKLLWSTAWKYQHIIDPDDMFQEIVLRLMKYSFLEKWEKEKSALNTFLTSRIRGYALHVITKKMREEPKSKFLVRLDKHRDFVEKDLESPGKGYFVEVCTEGTEDVELYIEEIKDLFKRRVKPLQAHVFEMYYWQGYSLHEIAGLLSDVYDMTISYSVVRTNCREATQSMLKILSKEGVHCEK